MLETLIWLTALVCAGGASAAYLMFRDVFHPALLIAPMAAFIYVYFPTELLADQVLYSFVTEEQAVFAQAITVGGLLLLFLGVLAGSGGKRVAPRHRSFSPATIQKGAYWIGGVGLACWLFTIKNSGGFAATYSRAYSSGWSEYGYIRDAVYLLLVAILLLLSPEGQRERSWKWWAVVTLCTFPWLAQAVLGARRGPTFVLFLTLGMSWYLGRYRRPALPVLVGAGFALGLLMLFLVTNRGSIYIGSEVEEFDFDVTGKITSATEANEYIFGIGCITTARQTDEYFWGARYLAQVFVRPVPRQIWRNKYADVGLERLEQNAGVASADLPIVMGWSAIPGAAAAMIADLWVEFSWGLFPVLFGIGFGYGRVWRNAVHQGGPWITQFVILCALSVYLVTQSGEAVIFRLVILSLPTWFVWKKADLSGALPAISREIWSPVSR